MLKALETVQNIPRAILRPDAGKPRVFIGSSKEGLLVAEAVQSELQHLALCRIWTEDLFKLSLSNLENLSEAIKEFDYAVLVMSPDDITIKRGQTAESPRDNLIFELGLSWVDSAEAGSFSFTYRAHRLAFRQTSPAFTAQSSTLRKRRRTCEQRSAQHAEKLWAPLSPTRASRGRGALGTTRLFRS